MNTQGNKERIKRIKKNQNNKKITKFTKKKIRKGDLTDRNETKGKIAQKRIFEKKGLKIDEKQKVDRKIKIIQKLQRDKINK